MQSSDPLKLGPKSTWRIRKRVRNALILVTLFCGIHLWRFGGQWNPTLRKPFILPAGNSAFHEALAPGFANYRGSEATKCNDLRVKSILAGTQSKHIEEDLFDVATSVNHIMVDYSGQPQDQTFAEMVTKTWGEMSGSSVWLEKYQLYLTVSRVYFYDKGIKHWAIISFLRVRLHNIHWEPVVANLTWHGESIQFPRTVQLDVPHEVGGCWYGPEDPRIIVEANVEDAEPVVVFNMVSDTKTSERAMYAYYPFSDFHVKFQIEDMDKYPRVNKWAASCEKNWAPFFLSEPSTGGMPPRPSQHIQFVYDLSPLRILRCHRQTGLCKFVFVEPQQSTASKVKHMYKNTGGEPRGGTNFEVLPSLVQTRPGLVTYIGLPRTHTNDACGKDGFYRPEITLLTTDGTSYYLDYMSEPLTSLDHLLLTTSELNDPCGEGRIVLANSIARIHDDQDTMDVTWSVNDASVQVAQIHGIQALVAGLPQWQSGLNKSEGSSEPEFDMQSAINATRDVLDCSARACTEYALKYTPSDMLEEHLKALREE